MDAGDYTIGRKQSGLNVAPGMGADANGDGKVNDADLAIWRFSFGMAHVSAGTTFAGQSEVVEIETRLTYATEQSATVLQKSSDGPVGNKRLC